MFLVLFLSVIPIPSFTLKQMKKFDQNHVFLSKYEIYKCEQDTSN